MPKQTFLNLSADKRQKILEAGIDEFADKGFRKAGVNRIVKNAGIPKGSFYQYFEDKKDMFMHIFELAANEKIRYIYAAIEKAPEMDFFSLFRELYMTGVEFAGKHPRYSCISTELQKDAALRKEMLGDQAAKSDEFFMKLLESGIGKGDIRSGIDVRFTANMLTSMNINMMEYFLQKHDINDIELIYEYADKFIDLIKNGIAGGGRR